MIKKQYLTTTAFGLALASDAPAAFINYDLPGSSSFDGWSNLTTSNPQVASASPGFPNIATVTAAWPEAISSDAPESGDATFDKASGGGFPGVANIYTGFQTAGSFFLRDNTTLPNLETVIFQLDIGFGSGPDFLTVDPTLTINDATSVPLFNSGIINEEIRNSAIGPINVRTAVFQWDVRGQGPIDSLEIDFTTDGSSSTIWGLQLDQGDQFTAIPVPEPSSLVLILIAALGLARRRRG